MIISSLIAAMPLRITDAKIACLDFSLQKAKMHLCNSPRAKDANVSQALKDKLGEVGTAKAPGPLYGIAKHAWAALAVGVYAAEVPW